MNKECTLKKSFVVKAVTFLQKIHVALLNFINAILYWLGLVNRLFIDHTIDSTTALSLYTSQLAVEVP
ncbi:hypothetical protein V5799_031150 [Amblyomma americanum]|uniref:Uncharacterized protein n=1 Tax=Amblyomma americanum TaxID=6943 RepID=A0AAQ4EL87_AMBAM